jgi:hypothetical protein
MLAPKKIYYTNGFSRANIEDNKTEKYGNVKNYQNVHIKNGRVPL